MEESSPLQMQVGVKGFNVCLGHQQMPLSHSTHVKTGGLFSGKGEQESLWIERESRVEYCKYIHVIDAETEFWPLRFNYPS